MKNKLLLFFFLTFLSYSGRAALNDTLYIIKTNIVVNGTPFQKAIISDSLNPQQLDNAVLEISSNSTSSFLLINTDTIAYSFYLNTNPNMQITISNEDTISVNLPTLNWGTHALLASNPVGKMLGAAVTIQVDLSAHQLYSWNLWETNSDLSQGIANQTINSIPSDYTPDVFAINMLPLAPMSNSNAIIKGNVGDTILISVVNTGNMTHNLHFHGYHITITDASQQNNRIGWSKDSFPIFKGESMTLRLVPDQPGIYPVHNHNLATLLFNNNYPSGMMSMLKINP